MTSWKVVNLTEPDRTWLNLTEPSNLHRTWPNHWIWPNLTEPDWTLKMSNDPTKKITLHHCSKAVHSFHLPYAELVVSPWDSQDDGSLSLLFWFCHSKWIKRQSPDGRGWRGWKIIDKTILDLKRSSNSETRNSAIKIIHTTIWK